MSAIAKSVLTILPDSNSKPNGDHQQHIRGDQPNHSQLARAKGRSNADFLGAPARLSLPGPAWYAGIVLGHRIDSGLV